MPLICARARDGIDDAAGCLAVFRGVIAGEDGKLLNGIDAEAATENAAWSAVGVVVEANPIQAIIILLRSRAGDGELLAEAAVAAIRASGEVRLGMDGVYARLELSKIGPTAAVEREFADGGGVDDGADIGTGELDGWGFGADFHGDFGCADLEGEVEDLLAADCQFDAGALFGVETGRGNGNCLVSG